MPREIISHAKCEHPDTQYARWKCRSPRRHAECGHEQNPAEWKKCAERKAKEK